MIKPVYPKEYKKYLQYCEEHGLEPYKLNTLQRIIGNIKELWDKPLEEKASAWLKYRLFKTRINNGKFKYIDEEKYYKNYKGKKVVYLTYIHNIKKGEPREQAIKYKDITENKKYYNEHKDEACVSYNHFCARMRNGRDKEKALTKPVMRKRGRKKRFK